MSYVEQAKDFLLFLTSQGVYERWNSPGLELTAYACLFVAVRYWAAGRMLKGGHQ